MFSKSVSFDARRRPRTWCLEILRLQHGFNYDGNRLIGQIGGKQTFVELAGETEAVLSGPGANSCFETLVNYDLSLEFRPNNKPRAWFVSLLQVQHNFSDQDQTLVGKFHGQETFVTPLLERLILLRGIGAEACLVYLKQCDKAGEAVAPAGYPSAGGVE
jgi:hypothetical protein